MESFGWTLLVYVALIFGPVIAGAVHASILVSKYERSLKHNSSQKPQASQKVATNTKNHSQEHPKISVHSENNSRNNEHEPTPPQSSNNKYPKYSPKDTVTLLDKGYATHFSDLDPSEIPLIYCIACAYPRYNLKNAEYWCLLTNKKLRFVRRINTFVSLFYTNEKATFDVSDICVHKEHYSGIQFFDKNEFPQECKAKLAGGGLIISVINHFRCKGLVFYFKSEDHNDIINFFNAKGQLIK